MVAVVTGANIVKAIEDFTPFRQILSFAHTFNLAVTDALKNSSNLSVLLEKCRKIVTYFKKSGPASAKLTLLSGNSTQKKLKQEVATRWNSSFFMLQSLLDLQQPVNDALVLLKPELKLEDVDWVVISEILSVLAPFEEITRDLSSQYYPSVSKAIPAAREYITM